MLTGLLARRWCKSPKTFAYGKFAERKPSFSKDQGLLTLHDSTLPPLSSMHNLRYKNYFGKQSAGLAHQAWSPHVVLSLSFSFSSWFPWSTGALCVYFPAWASKTHSIRCLRWGTFRDLRGCLWPAWTEQVQCWGFIGFLRKPRNISLFSLLYFLNCKILSLSLSLFLSVANAVLQRESLDPTGAGPW